MAQIVIIEDEQDQIELYRLVLTAAGHAVIGAGPWLDQARPRRGGIPDLVILDERLHGRSGSTLIPQLRREFPGAAIILLTADPDVVDEAVQRGADEGKQKPVAFSTLLSNIEGLLGAK